MIFSGLFTPAHKHSDPAKRLDSISKLEPLNKKHKEILHELAFNDASSDVCKAALHALDSFTLWLKAYETHMHASVRKAAKTEALSLIEDDSQVDSVLFTDIIQQEKHKVLVREMVFSSNRLLSDSTLCVSALLSICIDNDVRRFFSTRANQHQQIQIVEASDEKQLRRLKKLSNSDELTSHIDKRIARLEEQAALPSKVIAAATLINSRLLALTDLLDYSQIQDNKQILEKEFDGLKSDFMVLGDEKSSELSSKYLMLRERVDKRLASLESDYMAHLHLKGTSDALSDIEGRAQTIFEQVDMLGQAGIDDQLEGQIALLKRSIDDLSLELKDLNVAQSDEVNNGKDKITAAHRQMMSRLSIAFKQYTQQLDELPELIARNQEAAKLLLIANAIVESEGKGGANTSEKNGEHVNEIYAENSTEEQSIEDIVNTLEQLLAEGLSKQHQNEIKALKNKHRAQHRKQIAEVKAIEKRCFAKLNACKGMIEQGKFKAAIATFNSAHKLFEQVAEQTKIPASLNKRYEKVQEKVTELKDWQSYIAAPKKPELIGLVTALAQNAEVDVSERAALVKTYRSEFVSIGRLNTKEDDALNAAFDQAIEQAFEPCRKHYAKLDALREQNLHKGEQVLQALDALKDVEDPQILAKHLSAIGQQYRKLGELNKNARDKLHNQYQKRHKMLQQKVNAFYHGNAEAKQSLITKALKLSESEDINSAVDEAKALQSKWKGIGFAGAKHDQTLWSSFRQANDEVFARLKWSKEADNRELTAQKSAINEKLVTFDKLIASAEKLADLGDLDAKSSDIQSMIDALPKTQQKGLYAKLKAQQARMLKKTLQFESQKQNDAMQKVFALLERFSTKKRDESFDEQLKDLPASFKQAFEGKLHSKQKSAVLLGMDRKELTIAAHILLAEGKGFRESALKKGVQLKLMAAKLEGDAVPNAESLLLHWIYCGELKESDHDLLEKLRKLYGI